jgi:predicted amidophosphoribosyltransferase
MNPAVRVAGLAFLGFFCASGVFAAKKKVDLTRERHKLVLIQFDGDLEVRAIALLNYKDERKKIYEKYQAQIAFYREAMIEFKKDKENRGKKFDEPVPKPPIFKSVSGSMDYKKATALAPQYEEQYKKRMELAEKRAEAKAAKLEEQKKKREERKRILAEAKNRKPEEPEKKVVGTTGVRRNVLDGTVEEEDEPCN